MKLDNVAEGNQAFLFMERYVDEGAKTYSPFAARSEVAPKYQRIQVEHKLLNFLWRQQMRLSKWSYLRWFIAALAATADATRHTYRLSRGN